MLIAYASVYLLPALVFLLGIWMGIRLLAELGAGTTTRRGGADGISGQDGAKGPHPTAKHDYLRAIVGQHQSG